MRITRNPRSACLVTLILPRWPTITALFFVMALVDEHAPPHLADVNVRHLRECGLPDDAQAAALLASLARILNSVSTEDQLWHAIAQSLLQPYHPFALHRLLYYSAYRNWDVAHLGPPPAWIPTRELALATNLGQLLEAKGKQLLGSQYQDPLSGFTSLQSLSVNQPEVYWKVVLDALHVPFQQQPECILEVKKASTSPGGTWLPGATLNAAAWCLRSSIRSNGRDVAVAWRDEGSDDLLNYLRLDELRAKVCQVANALDKFGFTRGDSIAIDMPMTVDAVVIYLAIVLSGRVVVSIADSFASPEIATRLGISNAKGIFTQDFVVRGAKRLPLYARVVEAKAPYCIVLPSGNQGLTVSLRNGDVSWDEFLASTHDLKSPFECNPVVQPVDSILNILFSSGTTGEPKAIPWTHVTPIKVAADAWAHHDIRHGDVVAWPTNLGWMMGPWLVFAALLNGATIALYNGAPLGRGFAKFVQDAKVTMLGVVPSIVKAWKTSNCVEGLDWSSIRCFSSTGEASNVDDYLWLMGRACYRPVIEYCGGTEIGGAFATGSMLQPQSLSAFSTPAMGCAMFLLDEKGAPMEPEKLGIGECALDPMMLGASTTLLNANHYEIYFKDMPVFRGKILRRHGDEFERTAGGYYRAHGRVDDTMNLGGIKVSSVEIERVCNNAHESVLETAAVGLPASGSGPERLLIVTVLKEKFAEVSVTELQQAFNHALQTKANPLFKVGFVVILPLLPRTASNKIMRRTLRSQYKSLSFERGQHEHQTRSKL